MFPHCIGMRRFPMPLSELALMGGIRMVYLPISKLMLRTDPTQVPAETPRFPGERHTRLATFVCVTSTPLGCPVVPAISSVRFPRAHASPNSPDVYIT